MEENNNNHTPTSNHRALYKRTSIPRSQEELRERRMVFDQSLRKKHREQLITAKRFRQLTHREEKESAEDIDPYYRLTPEQVNALASDLKSDEKQVRMVAAQHLSKFILEPAQALIDYITQGDCMEALTVNIAAGPHDLWIKSVSAVPYMIQYLDSDNINLQEAAAGALGNMAAEELGDMTTEDDQVRDTIRKNGTIPPLVRLLDSTDPKLVQTTCFALANLAARASESQLHAFIAAGISPRLLHHLKEKTPDTVTDICWVLSYMTAGSKEFRKEIMHERIAPLLVENLRDLAQHGPVVLPIVRTLGNLCGGPDEYTKILLAQDGFLFTILVLTHSEHREDMDIVKSVVDANGIGYLADILEQHGGYDIRQGAAQCLLNIAYHSEKYMEMLPHQRLLPAFVDLVQSQDADIMKLGLQYIDLLLTRVPRGADVVQVTPNCMKALGSVTPMPDPELYVYANRLVDKFYGEATQELHG
ncbi:ARM repeat-containing protein [Lichtheimia hyalospora FSU 10163]|nr:ARM repeat-containing protein [Lichtheimia hyalospora FSU 10163]